MAPQHLYPRHLRALRLTRGLSLREVSLQTGIPIQSLSVYELGKAKAPITRLVQLAALYRVTLDRLFHLPRGKRAPCRPPAGEARTS